MNTLTRKLITTLTSLMAVGALALGSLITPTTAYAAPAHEEVTPVADGSRLELVCRETRRLLEGQQERLTFANDIAGKTQTWIDELKGQGKDTSALESALTAYKTAIASAQSQHDSAQNTFNTQAGFDGNCKLTDRDLARATLQTVRDGLRTAHRTLADGGRTFRRAVQEWRKANRPATATP